MAERVIEPLELMWRGAVMGLEGFAPMLMVCLESREESREERLSPRAKGIVGVESGGLLCVVCVVED